MESGWSLVAEQLVELRNRLSIARERERLWLRLVAQYTLMLSLRDPAQEAYDEVERLHAALGITAADLRRALEERDGG